MSREILFRAKRKDNSEWVEGYYRADPDLDIHFICGWDYYSSENGLEREAFDYEIYSDTLCQYTGLTDKNDKKIWENDIVKLPNEDGYFKCEWDEDAAKFVLNGDGLTVDFDYYYGDECEVIGNIFDNSELLEVEE